MSESSTCNKPSKAAMIVGWVLSVLPALLLMLGAFVNILQPEEAVKQTTALGYSQSIMLPLGIVLLASVILYLVPQTTVLGAILLTGYLGGAVDLHVRMGDPLVQVLFPVLFATVLWLGIYLREPRLRRLVPFRCCKKGDTRVEPK